MTINEIAHANLLALDHRVQHVCNVIARDFEVTWASKREKFGTTISILLCKPKQHFSVMFGIEREIAFFFSLYKKLQPRVLQAAKSFLDEPTAKGRVEPIVYAVVSASPTLEDDLRILTTDSKFGNLVVPFNINEFDSPLDDFYFRNRFLKYLFSRDLFDSAQAITDSNLFFGRNELVIELRDALQRGENIGLFGLRKVGKTSLLFKLKTLFEEQSNVCFAYADLQDAGMYRCRWFELLYELARRVEPSVSQANFTDRLAAGEFRKCMRAALKKKFQRIIFALDEIEHIAPQLRMEASWDRDFLELWKTLRAIQTENKSLNFIVCGVNATVIETPVYSGIDNPLFSMMPIRYVPFFSTTELREMVRTLGRYMGLRFEENVYGWLHQNFAGHPLICRQAVSFINKSYNSTERPFTFTVELFQTKCEEVFAHLYTYGEFVLGVIRGWYGEEFALLQILAEQKQEEFAFFENQYPMSARHLRSYGLVVGDPPGLTMPFLKALLRRGLKESEGVAGAVDVAEGESVHEKISKARNKLEPMLRRFVRRILTAKHGPEKWARVVLDAIPKERREDLQGVAVEKILREKLFFQDLLNIIVRNWNEFRVLEQGSQGRKVRKEYIVTMLDYINQNRADAHAREVEADVAAAVQVAATALITAVEEFLQD